ncbi:MAG: HEPN domain-containing protein [Planctomycetes bacterium]|nr:HEPN domain-containing protein [Planctomycetota bacterium]
MGEQGRERPADRDPKLKLESSCPTDTVCFHAQQCVEKYVKALLVLKSTPFPKTHDLGVLTRTLPESWQPDLAPEQVRRLSDYATVTRYPGDYEPVTLAEARAAIAIARKVRKHVRALLSPAKPRRRRT